MCVFRFFSMMWSENPQCDALAATVLLHLTHLFAQFRHRMNCFTADKRRIGAYFVLFVFRSALTGHPNPFHSMYNANIYRCSMCCNEQRTTIIKTKDDNSKHTHTVELHKYILYNLLRFLRVSILCCSSHAHIYSLSFIFIANVWFYLRALDAWQCDFSFAWAIAALFSAVFSIFTVDNVSCAFGIYAVMRSIYSLLQ